MECDHKDQIENDIHNAADREEDKRTLRVSFGTEYDGTEIVCQHRQ